MSRLAPVRERAASARVRDAAVADVDVIVDANVAMAMESEGKVLPRDVVSRGVERLLGDRSRGRYLVAVVEHDGGREELVGQLMLTLEWSDWRDGWWWWIQSVYVKPTWRRQGVYRALHDAVIAEVEGASDVCGVRLYVEPENHAARATYRALGMVESYRVMELPRTSPRPG